MPILNIKRHNWIRISVNFIMWFVPFHQLAFDFLVVVKQFQRGSFRQSFWWRLLAVRLNQPVSKVHFTEFWLLFFVKLFKLIEWSSRMGSISLTFDLFLSIIDTFKFNRTNLRKIKFIKTSSLLTLSLLKPRLLSRFKVACFLAVFVPLVWSFNINPIIVCHSVEIFWVNLLTLLNKMYYLYLLTLYIFLWLMKAFISAFNMRSFF